MRCLTLANELKKHSVDIQFICTSNETSVHDLIQNCGFLVTLLLKKNNTFVIGRCDPPHAHWLNSSWEQDVEETKLAIGDCKVDWLIIDHYGLDYRWESAMRDISKKILVIDDLADRKHDCDLLIDQTVGIDKEIYEPLVPKHCMLLIGTNYALLRAEFLNFRLKAMNKRSNTGNLEYLLVAMGGMDTANLTTVILEALSEVNWSKRPFIDVVLGSKSPYLNDVKQQALAHPLRVSVSTDVNNMAERMLNADLSIGAGGTTTWERCCLGLPSLIINVAKNQSVISTMVKKVGAVIYLGDAENFKKNILINNMQQILKEKSLLKTMSDHGFNIVDGKGTSRVIDCMRLIN